MEKAKKLFILYNLHVRIVTWIEQNNFLKWRQNSTFVKPWQIERNYYLYFEILFQSNIKQFKFCFFRFTHHYQDFYPAVLCWLYLFSLGDLSWINKLGDRWHLSSPPYGEEKITVPLYVTLISGFLMAPPPASYFYFNLLALHSIIFPFFAFIINSLV